VAQQQPKQLHSRVAAGSNDSTFDTIHAAHAISLFSVLSNPHFPWLLSHSFTERDVAPLPGGQGVVGSNPASPTIIQF
jgi:hypothetical protein